jgi:methyl coenzyme M reductase gamma subunit
MVDLCLTENPIGIRGALFSDHDKAISNSGMMLDGLRNHFITESVGPSSR